MRAEATFKKPGGERRLLGDVVKLNARTVWIRLDLGGRIVQRHHLKDHVLVWG